MFSKLYFNEIQSFLPAISVLHRAVQISLHDRERRLVIKLHQPVNRLIKNCTKETFINTLKVGFICVQLFLIHIVARKGAGCQASKP